MNNFKEAILTAIILFPIVALLITLPYVIIQYHKYGSINKWRTIIVYSFILYFMSAYFLVILPLPSEEFVLKLSTPIYNFRPFSFIYDIFTGTGLQLNEFATYFPTMKNPLFYEAIFNILLTVPFGIYLHYYFKCNLKKTLFFTFCLTLFFELTQLTGLYFIYPRPYRIFDVDDLILNTSGGLLGYAIGSLFLKIFPSRDEIDEQSYDEGQKVSFLRRVVSFFIDCLLIFILLFFTGLIIWQAKISKGWFLLPIIFYVTICLIFKKTVGMSLTKLKFVSFRKDKVTTIAMFIYYFWFLTLNFFLPLSLIILSYILKSLNYIKEVTFEYSVVVIGAYTLMILIIGFLKRLFHLRLSNEYLSGLELKSTISKPD